MRALIPTFVVLSCGVCSSAAAQWYLGLEVAANRYRGSSYDTSRTHVASEGRPGGGPALALLLSRYWRRVGVALRISYANPGFAVSGQGLSITDKTTGQLAEFTSLISTRVGGIGSSGAIRAEVGPALHLWDFDGEIRSRVGTVGAAAYEWPVSSRFIGAIRLEGMVSPSWFNATDVPPEFERRVTWRYGVGLALRYRLT